MYIIFKKEILKNVCQSNKKLVGYPSRNLDKLLLMNSVSKIK